MNYDEDDVKPSTNVKEASYFNIFECGRNILDKLDVTYQREFTASKKTSREVRITTRNCIIQKKPSPVASQVASPVASSYESPMTKRYWEVQENILTERMAGKDKGLIIESLKMLHSDLLSSIIRFFAGGFSKRSCTMDFFYSSSSVSSFVSLTFDDGAISFS